MNSANARELYLCFCNEVTADAFRQTIWSQPTADLTTVCAVAGCADKCTACLYNCEALFYETLEAPPGEATTAVRPREARLPWRRRLWRLLDRHSPSVTLRFRDLLPVLAGPGITTIATLANVVPSQIGPRAGRWHVAWTLRAGDGTIVAHETRTLAPAERIDVDAGAQLLAAAGGADRLHAGTLTFAFRNLDRGLVGYMRPHFTVLTESAAATVHSQGSLGKHETAFATTRGAAAQEQFIFAMNCEARSNRLVVATEEIDGHGWQGRFAADLPASGATLLRLDLPDLPHDRTILVNCASIARSKLYFLIAAEQRTRLSFDHL